MAPTLDKNEKVQCPYDPSHYVMRYKLHTHLSKCHVNYPNSNLVICKFNANHVIPAPEIQHHYETCPERHQFERPPNVEEKLVARKYPIHNIIISSDESWDDYNIPAYNPQEYCMKNAVITRLDVASAAVRKQFRLTERQRMNDLEYIQHAMQNHTSISTSRPATEARPSLGNARPAPEDKSLTNTNMVTPEKQPSTNVGRPAGKNQTFTDYSMSSAKENQPPNSASTPNKNSKVRPMSVEESSPQFILVERKGRRRRRRV